MHLIENKKAGLRFEVLKSFQAGIELTGAETKSLRARQGSLEGARVLVRGGEAYIVGMSISPYQVANTPAGYESDRLRRLLLNKKEIAEILEAESKKGLTVVPFEVYNSGRYLKMRIAIVRGKNKADKREDIKRRDDEREIGRVIRDKR
ncbi:MAG: SsrA-binding protein [Parcubacteria bacterium C7867-007]|nr:MAG: SsrA-binding protein [Parcubacteria bacterium C7867-007]